MQLTLQLLDKGQRHGCCQDSPGKVAEPPPASQLPAWPLGDQTATPAPHQLEGTWVGGRQLACVRVVIRALWKWAPFKADGLRSSAFQWEQQAGNNSADYGAAIC